jgi:hypothetical protein
LAWTLALGKCEFTPAQVITFPGWRWNFELLTLTMTSETRSALPLFTLDLWIHRAAGGERVKSRARGSIIGCLDFLHGQIPRANLYLRTSLSLLTAAVNSTGWNDSVEGDRLEVSIVAAERVVQYAIRFSCEGSASHLNHQRVQNRRES